MTEFELKDILYLSQYADYITDEDFLNIFNEKLSAYDVEDQEEVKNLIIDINENMTSIDDKYNRIVYDKLVASILTITSLEEIKTLTTFLGNQEYEEINYQYDDLLKNYIDEEVVSVKELHSFIDEDLKTNGLDSKYRYIIPRLDFIDEQTEYVALSVYLNDFDYQYENYNEVLEYAFSENYEEFLEEFFAQYTNERSKI